MSEGLHAHTCTPRHIKAGLGLLQPTAFAGSVCLQFGPKGVCRLPRGALSAVDAKSSLHTDLDVLLQQLQHWQHFRALHRVGP